MGGFTWCCVSGVCVVVLLLVDVAGLLGFWPWMSDLVIYLLCWLFVVVFMLFGVSSECCGFDCVAIRCVWMLLWVFGSCV